MIQIIKISRHAQNHKKHRDKKVKFRGRKIKDLPFFYGAGAGKKNVGEQVSNKIKSQNRKESEAEPIEFKSKKVEIAHRLWYGRNKLREKSGEKKRKNKTDNKPAQKIIGGIRKLLQQKFFYSSVPLQGAEHKNVKENTADNNENHPIVLLRNSDQFLNFLQK